MAGRGRFRIPTAAEMQKLDSHDPKVESLFKRKAPQVIQASEGKKLNQFDSNQGGSLPKVPTRETSSDPLKGKHTSDGGAPAHATVSKKSSAIGQSKSNIENADAKQSEPVLRKDAVLQPIAKSTKSNCILVNPRQRGNPIIKHIRNIPWEFGDTPADYEVGKAACTLYLSVRYHQLNPEYIHERLKKLGRSYDLRVLLVQVDVKDPHHALKELAKICILADCTLILAFSTEEAGRYLETYKIYENKPPDAVMEKSEQNFLAKFTDCLTSVKSVNKTDCITLLTSFDSFEKVSKASVEDLTLCPGVGPQKAQRLYNVLHEPFLKERRRKTENVTEKQKSDEPEEDISESASKS